MALPATVRKFEIALADADRGVYADLDWRVAQHPSESERYLIARVLARAIEHADGLEFSKGGVSDDSEPALVQRDLQGRLTAWIEIGTPAPERVHKATKACARVAIYTWKDPERLAAQLVQVHRAEAVEVYALPVGLLDAAAGTLERSNCWQLAISGRVLYLEIAGLSVEGPVERVAIRTS